MSSPVASCRRKISVEGLECPVFGRVVGDPVLPAVPDDEEPGAGEDADGVRMVVAAADGTAVEVGGRRFFGWFGLITSTVGPAPSNASTTGPSGPR